MTFKYSLCLLFLMFTKLGYNQEAELTIGVYPFISNVQEKSNVEEAGVVTGIAQDLLVQNPRFKVVSRATMDQLAKERDLTKGVDFVLGEIAEQGVALGAQKLLTGTLNKFELLEDENGYGSLKSRVFRATASVTLSLVDVAKGVASHSITITETGESSGMGTLGSSPEQAVKRLNDKIKKAISNWLVTILPSDFRILSIEKYDKKGLCAEFLVKGGSQDMGLEVSEKLDVILVETIEGEAGLIREKDLGDLEVSSVEGKVSVCKIKTGKEIINQYCVSNTYKSLVLKFQPIQK